MQRHKIRVSIDFIDKTKVQFLANMNKDMRVFKKHLPDENKELVLGWINHWRADLAIKGIERPYMGKLRASGKYRKGRKLLIPGAAIMMWYHASEKAWDGMFLFDDFHCQISFFTDKLTAKQRATNCRGYDMWHNPMHQDKVTKDQTILDLERVLGKTFY